MGLAHSGSSSLMNLLQNVEAMQRPSVVERVVEHIAVELLTSKPWVRWKASVLNLIPARLRVPS
jgi:hypothetical protein